MYVKNKYPKITMVDCIISVYYSYLHIVYTCKKHRLTLPGQRSDKTKTTSIITVVTTTIQFNDSVSIDLHKYGDIVRDCVYTSIRAYIFNLEIIF